MTTLGLNAGQAGSEIRVDLRSRFLQQALHLLSQLVPGAAVALVLGAYTLLRQQPTEGFGLLRQWGAWWLVVIFVSWLLYGLAGRIVDKLDRIGSGMQDMALAVTRVADRDDRERDRMITETAYVGEQVQKLGAILQELKTQTDRIESSLRPTG